MTSIDTGIRSIRTAFGRVADAWRWYDAIPPIRRIHAVLGRIPDGWRRLSRWLNSVMPKGLFARALLIIILPMVILQSVVAFVFMERHWNVVTQRLSAGVVADIAALIDIYRGYPQDADRAQIRRSAICRRRGPSPSSRCSTRRCRRNCASRSPGRFGSTPSASRRWSRSASNSTIW
jgi:two-component system osmolarity sensor histidine kinase EnvZ